MRERHVCHEASSEERADASLRAVEELIGHENVERLVLVLEAADRTGRQDALDAERLEAVDVRAEVQLRRENAMAGAVARQKGHTFAAKRAHHIRPGRIAKRGADR